MKEIKCYVACFAAGVVSLSFSSVPEKWPWWPAYEKTLLSEIRPQEWIEKNHVIEGWDWSLPPYVEPAPNSLMAIKRTSNLRQPLSKLLESLDLPINPTVTLWIKWRELEPEEGRYEFSILRKRIEEAKQMNYSVVLRILSSATIFAPDWISDYNVPIRSEHKKSKVDNYEISHPEFHQRYIRLVDMLGESGIPQMDALKGAYVGYASPSYGDEGIGPHGKDPDSCAHVIERLDAWGRAFQGVEHKVFMGGISKHGLKLGFGTRRGFVEMFLYHIPDETIGQMVDDCGYLWVDDSVDILQRKIFHGEENEEYEEAWTTAARDFRFGKNTDSFTYRYFTSNLRLLQMRCNYVLYNPFSIMPEQMVWVGQSLGRTVEDSPDVWCALRESYVRQVGPVKNFERWLYQRDSEGFETVPAVSVEHPVKMWMVEKGKTHDFIARRGRRIGFSVDERWCGGKPTNIAVKTTYFDEGTGVVTLRVRTKSGWVRRSIPLKNSGKVITSTVFIRDAVFSGGKLDYDLVYEGAEETSLSFVRLIRL